MDSILFYIQDHVHYAHWVIFFLLILAGLNFPISEDLLIIVAGVLSSTLVPENTWKLFTAIFLGAYLSDWLVYWIGRLMGPKLLKIPWFSRFFPKKRLKQIKSHYQRYGVSTLFVGRFIPFGVRNCLFFAAGIGKMHFGKFLVTDALACLLSNSVLFVLSFYCGKNSTHLLKYVHFAFFFAFLVALFSFIWYKRSKGISLLEKETD